MEKARYCIDLCGNEYENVVSYKGLTYSLDDDEDGEIIIAVYSELDPECRGQYQYSVKPNSKLIPPEVMAMLSKGCALPIDEHECKACAHDGVIYAQDLDSDPESPEYWQYTMENWYKIRRAVEAGEQYQDACQFAALSDLPDDVVEFFDSVNFDV